jgi:hypothetical protein
MPIPKKSKNDIEVYLGKELLPRRQQLLDQITKNDTYLPDSILHDDLDKAMLQYVTDKFVIESDGKKIPVIPHILTIQRWGELTNNWSFSDDDGNINLPFISIIRQPDVQPGTHPAIQRNIPGGIFHYATVQTWNGGQLGADVYKIPYPIAVDISYDVTIVCTRFRDLNKFNKKVLEYFAARQDYATIKGHFIPLILDSIQDNSPIHTLDGRRFYMQSYKFTMMGFLLDRDQFTKKPAINRVLLMTEFIQQNQIQNKIVHPSINIIVASFVGDGDQTSFGVGQTITILFNVSVNGSIQELGVDYFFIPNTSKITFSSPSPEGSIILITYYHGKNTFFLDANGRPIQVQSEYFVYDGSTLIFDLTYKIDSIVTLDVNGLVQKENDGFSIVGPNQVKLNYAPPIDSNIGVTYLY